MAGLLTKDESSLTEEGENPRLAESKVWYVNKVRHCCCSPCADFVGAASFYNKTRTKLLSQASRGKGKRYVFALFSRLAVK